MIMILTRYAIEKDRSCTRERIETFGRVLKQNARLTGGRGIFRLSKKL